ncbi:hypothetical protein LJC34_05060 [Oscillospiraceae bacterium OttesenSCG-928-G22]|nr:hypothetical protein [Oscillospiraceae bacterium OttesenSCG-928-G22]
MGAEHAEYGRVDSLYQKLMRFIGERRLSVIGDAYEEYLIDEVSELNPRQISAENRDSGKITKRGAGDKRVFRDANRTADAVLFASYLDIICVKGEPFATLQVWRRPRGR